MSDTLFSPINVMCIGEGEADRQAGDGYYNGENQLVNDTHDNGGNYDFAIWFDNPRNAQIRG